MPPFRTLQTEILEDLPPNDLRFLFANAPKVVVPARSVLFTPEDAGQTLFHLVRGKVDLFRLTRDGKRLVTRQVMPGSVFGVMRILGQPNRGNFAEAIDKSVLQSTTRALVLDAFRARPELALRLLDHLGSRLSEVEERLVAVAFSPLPVRLAHYLLNRLETSPDTVDTVAGISHAEVADTIGASRQSVTSTLNLMKKQGLVQIERRRIRIIDRKRLEEILSTGAR